LLGGRALKKAEGNETGTLDKGQRVGGEGLDSNIIHNNYKGREGVLRKNAESQGKKAWKLRRRGTVHFVRKIE